MLIGFLITAAVAAAVSVVSIHLAATWLGKLGILAALPTMPAGRETAPHPFARFEVPQLFPVPRTPYPLFIYSESRILATSAVVGVVLLTGPHQLQLTGRSPSGAVSGNTIIGAAFRLS